MRYRSGILSLMLAIIIGPLLSGCLLNRVLIVKGQFCDFESNFAITTDGRTNFLIHDPVLLDKDIIWLAGASPSQVQAESGKLVMTYEIEKVLAQPNPAHDMEIQLYFESHDDDFKLARVQFDDRLSQLFGPGSMDREMLNTAVQNVCEAGISMASTHLEQHITDQEYAMLPSREEMFEVFGEPSEVIEPGLVFAYEYRLKNQADSADRKLARIEVWFDAPGEKPLRMESSYSRYQAKADFSSRILQLDVNI
jgi:hypothetical protein